MIFDPNNLFYKMVRIFKDHYSTNEKVIICNEGGSRSSKSWDAYHLIIYICDHNRNKGLDIYILRDTLIHCRDFTYKDFLKVLQICQIEVQTTTSPKPFINLWGNNIYFRGLDDEQNTEGYPSDILFFNEALETQKSKFNGLRMRCRKLILMDWNPKFTDHWCFDLEGQPNTFFTRTTYKNNKHLERTIIEGIEAWCPWELDDIHLPVSERRPNIKNIQNGTVDKFRWLVYGEGIRAAMEGLVFDSVSYIDKLPLDTEKTWFGLDFGNTTGTYAFARTTFKPSPEGKQRGNIYLDCPIYEKGFEDLSKFYEVFKKYYELHQSEVNGQWIIICDNAQPQKITDLNGYANNDGLNVAFLPCKKFTGCVTWRIDLMKRHNIFLVSRHHIRKEQENYFYQTINGIQLNEPLKNGFDHFWDAAGMSIQYETSLR